MTTNYLAFYDGLVTCRDARLPFIAEALHAAPPRSTTAPYACPTASPALKKVRRIHSAT
jgi:hypothetical protein